MNKIIPQPQQQDFLEGNYTFVNEYSFECSAFPYAGEYLKGFLKISDGSDRKIEVIKDTSFEEEKYVLEITDKIKVTASYEKGIFRAFSTLKQLCRICESINRSGRK